MPVSVDEILQVRLIPFYETNIDKLGYSWKIAKVSSKSLEIQMIFENPLFVSASVDQDSLEVEFVNELYF